METRFATLGLDTSVVFNNGVSFTDERIRPHDIIEQRKKVWSIMYGHLDNIQHFLDHTTDPVGIFCEDDVMIHKRFKDCMPSLVKAFVEQEIDLCLLGYLLNFHLPVHYSGFQVLESTSTSEEYKLYNYTDDVWGAQMFAMSRQQAAYILEKYTNAGLNDYAAKAITDTTIRNFSADFSLTKDAKHNKRYLLYPPLVLEDNLNDDMAHYGNHIGQFEFHKQCFQLHYDANVYV